VTPLLLTEAIGVPARLGGMARTARSTWMSVVKVSSNSSMIENFYDRKNIGVRRLDVEISESDV